MARFKQRLEEVEAIQFNAPKTKAGLFVDPNPTFTVRKNEVVPVGLDQKGPHTRVRAAGLLRDGDWLILRADDTRSVLTNDAFRITYEPLTKAKG